MEQTAKTHTQLMTPALRTYWISRLAVSLVYPVVAVRKLGEAMDSRMQNAALIILMASFLLYLIEPLLVRRGRLLRLVYTLVQASLVLALGWLRPYEDTWALLFIPLSMGTWYEYIRREAALWSIVYGVCLVVTMVNAFEWFSGLGYSLTYFSLSAICVSYGSLSIRAEKAQAESQKYLRELQAAHTRLEEFAWQTEKLAVTREHDRLVRELHDSVSQTIFSLTLAVESTRLLLQKDPGRVPEQLSLMQELTGSALSRMRALISQLKTG